MEGIGFYRNEAMDTMVYLWEDVNPVCVFGSWYGSQASGGEDKASDLRRSCLYLGLCMYNGYTKCVHVRVNINIFMI
jgi:hypothetical protein